MDQVQDLVEVKEWKQLLDSSSSRPVVLLKHSTRCPVSSDAYDQFYKHINQAANPNVDYAIVLVVEHRPVSNAVAEDTGVKHESPQVLLLQNGEVTWHTSHWRITAEALQEKVSGL